MSTVNGEFPGMSWKERLSERKEKAQGYQLTRNTGRRSSAVWERRGVRR